MKETLNVIVIAGSAGAIEPLITVVQDLLKSLPAAVLICTHRPEGERFNSILASLLERQSVLPVAETYDGMRFLAGRVYIARIGVDIYFERGRLVESDGLEPRHWRPSIDDILVSAADAFGKQLTVVILSGATKDGIEGLQHVWRRGGYTIVQDPNEAQCSAMPTLAIMKDHPNIIVPANRIAKEVIASIDRPRDAPYLDIPRVTKSDRQLAR